MTLCKSPASLRPSPGQTVRLFAVWHPDNGLVGDIDGELTDIGGGSYPPAFAELYTSRGAAMARAVVAGWGEEAQVLDVELTIPQGGAA